MTTREAEQFAGMVMLLICCGLFAWPFVLFPFALAHALNKWLDFWDSLKEGVYGPPFEHKGVE